MSTATAVACLGIVLAISFFALTYTIFSCLRDLITAVLSLTSELHLIRSSLHNMHAEAHDNAVSHTTAVQYIHGILDQRMPLP